MPVVLRRFLSALLAAALALPALAAEDVHPALVVNTLDGKPFRLEDHRGHVVLVHFWATWCAPCREEMPALDAYQRRHAGAVDVIAVSVDRSRDLAEVRKAMQGLAFPAALAHDASVNSFGRQNAIPVTFVVDAGGQQRLAMRPDDDPVNETNLARRIDPLLPRP